MLLYVTAFSKRWLRRELWVTWSVLNAEKKIGRFLGSSIRPNLVLIRPWPFFERSPLLYRKQPLCVFEPPFAGLGVTYAVHIRLIGKPVEDFLLVIIELFFTRCKG